MSFSHILWGESAAAPIVRRIAPSDLLRSLSRGFDDFLAMPSYAIFLCIIYPVLCLFLFAMTFGYALLPLAFPIAGGTALLGPFAALGLYELSRRREAGLDTSPIHVFDVLRSRSLGAIIGLGFLLIAIFAIWLVLAEALYIAIFGYQEPASIVQFLTDVFTTPPGWTLIIVGAGVGFLIAMLVLTISVISFPLLLDRDVGAAVALQTSIRVTAANPLVIAMWGCIVAAMLLVGALPFFLGLTVVLPVLSHATWHVYRATVEADPKPYPDEKPSKKVRRYAADFPSALFPTSK